MSDYFKTPKGTELPFLNLRGKKYLQVAHRLVWLREEHPNWGYKSTLVKLDKDYALFHVELFDETGKLISDGFQDCFAKDFPDHIAKAQTSALGRALAGAGYGTAFAEELDEGARLSDAPLPPKNFPPPVSPQTHIPNSSGGGNLTSVAGNTQPQDPSKVSMAQLKRLYAIQLKTSWTTEQVRDLVKTAYGYESLRDLTKQQYDYIVNCVEKMTFEHAINESIKT